MACALPNTVPAVANTNARPDFTTLSTRTVLALRAWYMSVTEPSRLNTYRYAIPSTSTNIRGRNIDRNAASNVVHVVVSATNTTSEIDAATRMTMRPAERRPWLVSPTGCPNQRPSGTTTWPGEMKLNVAGSTTMPVKIG